MRWGGETGLCEVLSRASFHSSFWNEERWMSFGREGGGGLLSWTELENREGRRAISAGLLIPREKG